MAKVTIFCDQRFLKPISEIARVLREYGRFDSETAHQTSIECAGKRPVSLQVADYAIACTLVEKLREIDTVNANITVQE